MELSIRATADRNRTRALTLDTVKFDTEQLPSILNALTTQNGEQHSLYIGTETS
jgi:hypothetical protein